MIKQTEHEILSSHTTLIMVEIYEHLLSRNVGSSLSVW